MITIVIAEDHHVVRQGLRLILELERDFSLVGEAADGLEAVKMVERYKPDVLLLDLVLPKLHGLEVTRQVKKAKFQTKIIILSMYLDEPYLLGAMRNGADGYVVKSDEGVDLVRAIRDVLKGTRYFSPTVTGATPSGSLKKNNSDTETIDLYQTVSARERVVLQLAAEGLSNNEIAARLFISPRTVETHRANIMQKLRLHSQTELVRFAIRRRIISP
jgi:DNA-binding NarL/FixJ family response regulator